MAAKYVVAGGVAPWPYSPYLTYGPMGKTALVGDVVDDLPGEDIRFLLDAGYIVAEKDWVAPAKKAASEPDDLPSSPSKA